MNNKKIRRLMALLILVIAFVAVVASVSALAPPIWEPSFGTGLNQYDDDSDNVPIGFNFDFYGVTYSNVWVNSNGNVTFNGANYSCCSPAIPYGSYAIAAPIFGDFNPYWNGDVYYNTLGTAPNRRFVATWVVVPEYSQGGSNTFQVQLFEGSNEILFGYNGLTTDGINWNSPAMQVGISSGTGLFINSASGGAIPALDGTNICYSPSGGNYTVSFGACNAPPTADAGGPYLVAVDSTIQLDGMGTDPDGDPLTYAWSSDEAGSSFDSITPPATSEDPLYTAASTPGIYELTLNVDDGQANASDTAMVVVYDSDGGFVTGGGWILSPDGACPGCEESPEGKANFGFVAKYRRGADVPSGNTQFQFQAGDLNFHSTSYEWLVVAGNKAQFKGEGTINGEGSYKFMLSADDDDPDTFRIQIWGGTGTYYDNGSQQALGGGSIKVHSN